MPYATVRDYIAILGEQEALEHSNLDDPHASTINEAVIAEALQNASSEIDSYIATRYQANVSPVPPMLKQFAVTLARCKLDRYVRREHVAEDCKETREVLLRIAQGKQALLCADGLPVGKATEDLNTGRMSSGKGIQTFTRQNLSSFGRSWE